MTAEVARDSAQRVHQLMKGAAAPRAISRRVRAETSSERLKLNSRSTGWAWIKILARELIARSLIAG